jgi:hypothetical protein
MPNTARRRKTGSTAPVEHDPHTWHFFIYDVLYIGGLAFVIFELFSPDSWRVWIVQAAIAAMYIVDCLYTRAFLHSFDPDQARAPENILNACIPVGVVMAFVLARSEHFSLAFALLAVLVLMAMIINWRRADFVPIYSVDVPMLLLYGCLAYLSYRQDLIRNSWTVALSWAPTIWYAVYAVITGIRQRRMAPQLAREA